MDAHEVLCRARNILDRTPWSCSGAGSDGPGVDRCLEEVLVMACGRPASEWPRADEFAPEAYGVLVRLSGEHWLYSWNDHVCQSKAQALGLFDRAISATAPEPDPARVYTSDDRVLFTTGPTRVYIDGVVA